MNTYELTAPATRPPFLFAPEERSYAVLLYIYEIIDHTHAIFSSVALIQVVQLVAREPVATETVTDLPLPSLFTGFDPACDAGY